MRVEKTVFISYRRTNVYHARAIYLSLSALDYDVFLDYEDMDPGAFERVILREIDARAHFVLALTPSALERCVEPDDLLRREIERAIEMQRNIVPLMFEPFSFSAVEEYLIGKLALLKEYNGLPIPESYFNEAMERLHNRFLSKPLDMLLHPTPSDNLNEITRQLTALAAAPEPTEEQISAEQHYEQGNTHRRQGNLEEAIASYTEAINLNPEYAAAYNNRGGVYRKLSEIDRAIVDYTTSIELKNPELHLAYNNRGRAYAEQDDLNKAIADYTKAIEINPKYAAAYDHRAAARYLRGDDDGALADYNAAIRLNPSNVYAYLGRGLICADQGDYDGAIADCEEALRIKPGSRVVRENLERLQNQKLGMLPQEKNRGWLSRWFGNNP